MTAEELRTMADRVDRIADHVLAGKATMSHGAAALRIAAGSLDEARWLIVNAEPSGFARIEPDRSEWIRRHDAFLRDTDPRPEAKS